jgi:hypothetical protein
MARTIADQFAEVAAVAAGTEAHLMGELAVCGLGNLHLIIGPFDWRQGS